MGVNILCSRNIALKLVGLFEESFVYFTEKVLICLTFIRKNYTIFFATE